MMYFLHVLSMFHTDQTGVDWVLNRDLDHESWGLQHDFFGMMGIKHDLAIKHIPNQQVIGGDVTHSWSTTRVTHFQSRGYLIGW